MNSRYSIFCENFDNAAAHNGAEGEQFTMGINRFSDLTLAEFSALYDT